MKREMEDEDMKNEGEDGSTPMLKRRRGEGPHIDLRILLASKVWLFWYFVKFDCSLNFYIVMSRECCSSLFSHRKKTLGSLVPIDFLTSQIFNLGQLAF